MADSVETSSASTAGELREVGRLQDLMGFTVVLRDLVQHYCACRHVDSHCECFGGENYFHQTLCEALLYRLLETWNKTGMVNTYTSL